MAGCLTSQDAPSSGFRWAIRWADDVPAREPPLVFEHLAYDALPSAARVMLRSGGADDLGKLMAGGMV